MNFLCVNFKSENNVGYITINNPPVNALNGATILGLHECLDYVSQEADIKVVIITGEGNFFVAGADINELTEAFDDHEKGEEISRKGQELFYKIENFDKPIIAAINGACLGGGLELAMSCHMRVAVKEAKLGLPETNLGIIPGFGGTQRLPRLTNKAKALELILTGITINGDEAEGIGLVNHSFLLDDLMPKAKELAEKISLDKSALSIKAAMHVVSKGLELTLEEGQDKEAKQFGQMFMTEDAKEGIRAFLEKRKAKFIDL